MIIVLKMINIQNVNMMTVKCISYPMNLVLVTLNILIGTTLMSTMLTITMNKMVIGMNVNQPLTGVIVEVKITIMNGGMKKVVNYL